jgi:hypothetical protein
MPRIQNTVLLQSCLSNSSDVPSSAVVSVCPVFFSLRWSDWITNSIPFLVTDSDPRRKNGKKEQKKIFLQLCPYYVPMVFGSGSGVRILLSYLMTLKMCTKISFFPVFFCLSQIIADPDPGRPKNIRILRIRIRNTAFSYSNNLNSKPVSMTLIIIKLLSFLKEEFSLDICK